MTTKTLVSQLVDSMEVIISRFGFQRDQSPCEMATPQEAKVIFILGRHGRSIMSQIAEGIGISMSGLTTIIDKLVDKGFAERERSDEDRRIVRVDLTEKGRELYGTIREHHLAIGRGMLSALNPQEQKTLVQLFEKVAQGSKP